MKEEFETYADALWWGLVSHYLGGQLCGIDHQSQREVEGIT